MRTCMYNTFFRDSTEKSVNNSLVVVTGSVTGEEVVAGGCVVSPGVGCVVSSGVGCVVSPGVGCVVSSGVGCCVDIVMSSVSMSLARTSRSRNGELTSIRHS